MSGAIMALALFFTPAAFAQDNSAAVQIVERFHDALLTAMKNADTWPYEERRASLSGIVDESFDFNFMARFASGSTWKNLGEEDQTRIADAFENFTLANYAARFHGYSGQEFEFLTAVPQRGGRVLIRTQLMRNQGGPVRLDYLMTGDGDAWRIVDVFLDGKYSELALRRSEFSPILRDEGVDGLVATLEERANRLAAGDDTAG